MATQRSFIMIGVVLCGVLLDRPTLTMRTLTIAALVVLLFAPESIVHPSFQMSFAATLALIAGYERGAITPLGASHAWPVIADESILSRPLVSIGGGVRGVNVHLAPSDLVRHLGAQVADVTMAE